MATKRKSLTLRQIAKLAGTSKSTVSRVLTNHPSVSPETRARIERVIQQRQFRPNPFARGLAGGPTGLIAIIAPEINSGFYAEVMRGVHEVTSGHNGHLLSCIANDPEDYVSLWESFSTGGRVDGIILLAPPTQILQQTISRKHVPAVLCACRAERNKRGWNKVDTVTVNNEEAVEAVVKHLAEQGRKHFIHVAGPRGVHDARARREGFRRATKELKGVHADVVEAGLNREDGRKAVVKCLNKSKRRPDAFVCFNDSTAFGVLEALKERRIAVPDEAAVSGCDDEPASAILGLTSLHMPMRELGREAASLLFSRVGNRENPDKGRHRVFNMTLEARASTQAKADKR